MKSLKKLEIQEAIRQFKDLNFSKENDHTIESEIKKCCSNRTPFNTEEWLSLLWRRVALIQKNCNRYLTMIGGGIIFIAMLFWALLGMFDGRDVYLTKIIFLVFVFVLLGVLILNGVIELAKICNINILLSFILLLISVVLILNTNSRLLFVIVAFIFACDLLYENVKVWKTKKDLGMMNTIELSRYLILTTLFILSALIFHQIYGFREIGIDEYKISLLILAIVALFANAFGWLTQYNRLKAEEIFNMKLIMEVMTGTIAEPKEICAIFTSNQNLIEKGLPLGYSYIKKDVKKKLSMN
jgi:hypothetical membrane protein